MNAGALLDALLGLTSGETLGGMLAVAAGAGLLLWALRRLARSAERAGLDPDGRVGRGLLLLSGGVVAAATLLVLRSVARHAPGVAPWALAVLALVAAAGLASFARSFVAGLAVALRHRVQAGDRIQVGPYSGRVERVGLLSLQVRTADGSALHLPTHRLQSEALVVGHAHRASPVEVHIRSDRPLPLATQEALARVAHLCPYRDPLVPVTVEGEGPGAREVTVLFGVWSDGAVALARAQVGEAAERLLAEDPPAG